ncbi:MAG: hypothetical protein PHV17_04865, partial [Candidatus Omnitrophica bacterium]|nr:hypothetical protein [Candidatus Omnitrophota bacterium]
MKYNQSNILVFNCGSSSLKYKIIRMPEEEEIIVGEAERVGIKTGESSFIDHCVKGQKRKIVITLNDHCDAFREIIRIIKDDFSKDKSLYFDVCAHRYVHPGNSFKDTTKIDDSAVKRLKLTLSFAPIHNPIAYNLIVLCRDYFPD